MNLTHFWSFAWLHWRLRVNQTRKGGIVNAIFWGLIGVGALLLSLTLFIGMIFVGKDLLDDASSLALMYVWDGFILVFLFWSSIGLVSDLQRAEALSLTKFLHLPISLTGVFVLNYLSSLLNLTMIVTFPALVGLSVGLVIGRGAQMLLLFPLVLAFLLMVTALIYQFQGWLASLMTNKRRRRTVVVIVTMVFVLIFQIPNLINMFWLQRDRRGDEDKQGLSANERRLRQDADRGVITRKQFEEERDKLRREQQGEEERREQAIKEQINDIALVANMVLPLGWLAYGAKAADEANWLGVAWPLAGMVLLGAWSLRRAYFTTLRIYTGTFTSRAVKPATKRTTVGPAQAGFVERELPWLSPYAAAIALASLRSMLRAPEVKMMLLAPLIFVFIFGAMFLRSDTDPPPAVRPLMASGAVFMVFMTMLQLVGNQFGFDRSGFRVYVLSPAPRRDILLGKNLALAPLALGLALGGIFFVQVAYPMRWDHLLALLPQTLSMFLVFMLLANCMSLLAPMPIAAGTLRPTNTRAAVILLNVVLLITLPVLFAPLLAPLGIEVLLTALGYAEGWPVFLVLSCLFCLMTLLLFRWLIGAQGAWLAAREQDILATVAAKAE